MNYIVSESICAEGEYFEVIHPFTEYTDATQMMTQCINESTDDDYISMFVMDDSGDSYELPII